MNHEGTGMPKQEMIDGIDKYKVENAAETLIRAEEVKADKKLLAAARGVIEKKLNAMKKV